MKKFFKVLLRILITLIIIAAVAAGGYYLYLRNQAQQRQTAFASLQFTRVTTGNLQATVGATGNVRSTQNATIVWQASGKVGSVKAKVGDTVKAGQVLASLDPTSLSQSMISAQADLITAEDNLTTLTKVDPLALANAQKAVVDAQNAVDTAQQNRDNFNGARIGSQDQIDAAYAQVLQAQQAVDKAQTNYDNNTFRQVDDPIRAAATAALSKAKATLATAQMNLAYLQGKGSATDIRNADTALTVAKAQLQSAIDNLNTVKAGPTTADVQAAQARIDAIKLELAQVDITAPFDGTITDISVMTGDLVSPGTAAFRIDVLNPLYVDVQVSELDIANVQVGQAVTLTFDGIPNKTYNGTVTDISTIGVTSSGVVNYTTTVAMKDPDALVKIGMSASANIVTKEVDNVLILPARAVHTVNNRKVVYTISATGSFTAIQVTTGMSNDTNVEIQSGVKSGDRLVVNPPTSLTLAGGGTNPFASLFGLGRVTTGGFGGGAGGFRTGGGGGNFGGGAGGTSGTGGTGGTNSGRTGGGTGGSTGGN